MKILLVEDNPGDARLLEEILKDSGLRDYELVHATTLAEARAALAIGRFEVVLLDLSLPDSHGLETVHEALPQAAEAALIVLTGLDDESVALQAMHAGAQDYIVKGNVDGQVLLRAIRYARERKRLEIDRIRALEREQEARATAEGALRARDEVLRIVSHDLGNSLSAIGLHCRLMERGDVALDDVARRASTIRRLVDQMHRLRQDLVDIASLEAGRLAMEIEEQRIDLIVSEALDAFEGLARRKRVTLRQVVAGSPPRVTADRMRILQVLSNLIGNAIKFTPEGGEIVVRIEVLEAEVRVSVEDTGPGIRPDDAERVFEPFWRQGEGDRAGAGLGLAIARGIISRHGGRLWVESEPGSGSAFRFTLPVLSPSATAPSPEAGEPTLSS